MITLTIIWLILAIHSNYRIYTFDKECFNPLGHGFFDWMYWFITMIPIFFFVLFIIIYLIKYIINNLP